MNYFVPYIKVKLCVVKIYFLSIPCDAFLSILGEFLKQCKPFVEEGVHPRVIIRAFRRATNLVNRFPDRNVCLKDFDPIKQVSFLGDRF